MQMLGSGRDNQGSSDGGSDGGYDGQQDSQSQAPAQRPQQSAAPAQAATTGGGSNYSEFDDDIPFASIRGPALYVI